jgi:hypothetical protein
MLDDAKQQAIEAMVAATPADAWRGRWPVAVIVAEAALLALLVRRHWLPGPDGAGVARPGLKAARLPEDTADTIDYLVEQANLANGQAHALEEADDDVERGRAVLGEITSVLRYWAVLTPAAAPSVRSLLASHDGGSSDRLALALVEQAALAARIGEPLNGLCGFDPARITEARTLAAALRERPAKIDRGAAALQRRNRVLALLAERVRIVRSAARCAFRGHADLGRQFQSEYERRQRRGRGKAVETASSPA